MNRIASVPTIYSFTKQSKMEKMKFYIAEINTNLLKTIGGRQGELIELIHDCDIIVRGNGRRS